MKKWASYPDLPPPIVLLSYFTQQLKTMTFTDATPLTPINNCMKKLSSFFLTSTLLLSGIYCNAQGEIKNPYYSRIDTNKLKVSNETWKKILPSDLYDVARTGATERAFTGKYWETDVKGTYYCAVCGNPLFKSGAKFASTCGWPSFFETIRPNSVIYIEDHSFGMDRTEVRCGRCGSHLGHIFDDGPLPTHKRYCMNSVSLEFEPDK